MGSTHMNLRRGPQVLRLWAAMLLLVFAVMTLTAGCEVPSAMTVSRNYALRPDIPVDPPGPPPTDYDDCVVGGQLYKQYCGSCHNARPLGERPFSNYHV